MSQINVLATLRQMGFSVKASGDELILRHKHCIGCKAVPPTPQAFGIALNWLAQSQKVCLDRAHQAIKDELR